MSHLDEGQLAALLDDELEPAEKLRLEAHLAGCADCRALWDDTRAFAAEADRLVSSIEVPPRAGAAPVMAEPIPVGRPTIARRTLPWRTLAWAASVVLAVGLGYSMRSVARSGADSADLSSSPDSHALAVRSDKAAAPVPQAAVPPATRQEAPLRRAPVPVPGPGAGKESGRVASELEDRATAPSANAALDPGSPAALATAPAAGASQPRDNRAREADGFTKQAPPAPTLAAPPAGGFRPVEMEVAVRTLAGSIRLVDGLEPQQVLAGPGRLLAGGDPGLEVIRVVYQDPPGRELWLDQQRVAPSPESALASRTVGLLPGDTLVGPAKSGAQSIRWIDQHGFRLALTGFLPADSLRALIPRVR